MTISSSVRKAGPFTGGGSTGPYAFSFKVFQASDLYVVTLVVATGVQTVLALTTDYTVSLNSDQDNYPGGTITLTSSLATGYNMTITSSLDYLQPVVLTNAGGFYPKVISDALDRLTIFCQQLYSQLTTVLRYPLSDASVGAVLPTSAQRANAVLAFNATGAPIAGPLVANIGITFSPTIQRFSGTGSQTTFTLSTNPGTATALIVAISGVLKVPSVDFTVSGTTLTFTAAPASGTNNISVQSFGTAGVIYTPADGTVATSSIQDGAVTSAKLATGLVSYASAAQIIAGALANYVTAPDQLVIALKTLALPGSTASVSDGATITLDLSSAGGFYTTLAGTGRTIAVTNLREGGVWRFAIKQDGAGNRTITTWPTMTWLSGGSAPTLSTVAGKVDIVTFAYINGTLYGSFTGA